MARIAGVEIPQDKQIRIALTYIYGIGQSLSSKILREKGIDPKRQTKDLTEEELSNLREIIEKNYKVEGDLRRARMLDVKRLKEIGSWRGTRHAKGLPARGQRTRTNSRTVRGNVRRTAGSGKRTAPEKT